MTTLLSWISVDSRGPSAIYIVTDSRITWGSSQKRWDSGRKVFASQGPDIFAYCGEVLFPSLVLGQLIELADRGILWDQDCISDTRHAIILEHLKFSFSRRHNAPSDNFSIVHCARDGSGLESKFRAWSITYDAKNKTWSDDPVPILNESLSKPLLTLGSGADALDAEINEWNKSQQGQVARGIFSAFCDSIERKSDKLSGGMPQIVSIDRISGGKIIGFISDSARYVYGIPVEPLERLNQIEWVDRLFQRISPITFELLSGAQRHARDKPIEKDGLSKFLQKNSKT